MSTLLYPRLIKARADKLSEGYPEFSIDELAQRADTADDGAVYAATGGTRAQTLHLQELREIILATARTAGFPNPGSRGQNEAFDLDLAEQLHRHMRLAPAEAAAMEVWSFIAVVLAPDVVKWRYERMPVDRLTGRLTRNAFGRLWWRAELIRDPLDPNPYGALKILNETSFEQIFERRASIGGSPRLIKAILSVWNANDSSSLTERTLLRDFLKRLQRLSTFVVFDALDQESLISELNAVLTESIQALDPGAHMLADSADNTTEKIGTSDVAFAQWLQYQMAVHNYSEADLAQHLGLPIVAPISAWVNGRSTPKPADLRQLLELFGR